MGVDGRGYVADSAAHFDGDDCFGDEFAGAGADDAAAEHAVGGRIDDPLCHAVGAAIGDGAAARLPGVLRDSDVAIGSLGFLGSEAGPGDFWIGEYDGGNGLRLEGGGMSG